MPPAIRARLIASLLTLACLGAGLWGVQRLELSTDVTHFLPPGEGELGLLTRVLSRGELVRTWILSLGGADEAGLARASEQLEARLQGHPEILAIRGGFQAPAEDALRRLYLERAPYFVGTGAPLGDDELDAAAHRLRSALGGPAGALARALAPRDPFLTFSDRLDRMMQEQASGLVLSGGRLFSADRRHAILLLETRSSPFDSAAQRPLLEAIEGAFAAIDAGAQGALELEQSSVHRIAVRTEARVRRDVTRIGLLGSIGVLLLFLILFRSPRQLLLLLLPMAAGVGSGFAVGALVFGRVHGLTIAFGASLVGVCVDYAVHVICHRSLSPQGPALATSERRLWAGIWLGGGTTLAGLLGLAWTSFPGLREIAWVAFVGVLVALALTRLLLPAWLPAQLEPAPLPRRLSAWLYTLLGVIGRRRRPLALLSLLALGLCAAGLPRLVWADSLSALSHLDPALLAEDEAVRARVGRMDGSRMVIALGADSAEALARNELAADALEAAVAAGELEAFRSLRVMLPSEASQRRRLEALRADRSLPARLDAAFERAGFVSGTFAPFFDSLAHAPEPLALPELLDSSLGAAARPFRVQLEDRVAILLFVRGVRASDALEARLGALEGVHYLDQQALFTRAYGGFRERTLQQIGLGLIFVLLLLLLRYRRLGPALAALLPAVLAALATLGLLGHLGLEANLMHLVALLLVLSIGVDYGVFVIEHRDAPEALGPTLFAMGVACLTTLLGFGLLALSEDPPLRSLGIAVTLGVLLAAWLAPLSLWIVGRGPAR